MATKVTQCTDSGAALGKRQLLWPTVPATVIQWDLSAIGSLNRKRPKLRDRRDTFAPWQHLALWAVKPKGLPSDCTLHLLAHGENVEGFNLKLLIVYSLQLKTWQKSAGGSIHKCWILLMAFTQRYDLLFHFVWYLRAAVCSTVNFHLMSTGD